jgi:hypothetical protein
VSKIDTVKWKEYEVGELFDVISKTSKIKEYTKKNEKDETYCIPALSSKVDNNSFGFYVKKEDHELINRVCLSVTLNGDAGKVYVQNSSFAIAQDAYVIYLKKEYESNKNEMHYLYLATVLEKILMQKYGYTNKATWNKVKTEKIKLPTKNNQPDWEYMANYITEIENKYINTLEHNNNEKIEQALKVIGLSKEVLNEELKVEPAKRYEKFRVGDLFDKKTIKGVPKSKEKLQENKTGYHVFGQNIKYQYPQKVLLEEQYLQTIQTPILAYSSSTAQIGYIKENFYRTGDNGAFQGLFPKKTNVAIHSLLYILVVLKKQFDWFGYATEMGNILNLEITLPATNENTPDFEYMEKAIYIYFRQIIQNWKLSNEKEIEELKQVINK